MTTLRSVSAAPAKATELARRLATHAAVAIHGKDEPVRLSVVALLARGHLLIEDVPGVGKTTLARALARAAGGTFQRIQFTSDLLPSDILGVTVYEPSSERFVFKRGPLFANVVLADEINRTTPKTQSALLEAMGEGQVSVDGVRHPLPPPFLVIATQNPIEHHGTYPLPESQLDRFLLRVRMGYPDAEAERTVIRRGSLDGAADVEPAATAEEVAAAQEAAEAVTVDDAIVAWIQRIAAATRGRKGVQLGVSPRASVLLVRAARAAALLAGRDFVVPDDVKWLCRPVLAHRLVLASRAAPTASDAVIDEVVDEVDGPA